MWGRFAETESFTFCSSLNKPVIRDSNFGYKGHLGTDYFRNVKIMSLFSKSCTLFVPFKIAVYKCKKNNYLKILSLLYFVYTQGTVGYEGHMSLA